MNDNDWEHFKKTVNPLKDQKKIIRKQQGVQAVRDGQSQWRHWWGALHRRVPKKKWNLDHGER